MSWRSPLDMLSNLLKDQICSIPNHILERLLCVGPPINTLDRLSPLLLTATEWNTSNCNHSQDGKRWQLSDLPTGSNGASGTETRWPDQNLALNHLTTVWRGDKLLSHFPGFSTWDCRVPKGEKRRVTHGHHLPLPSFWIRMWNHKHVCSSIMSLKVSSYVKRAKRPGYQMDIRGGAHCGLKCHTPRFTCHANE